MIGNLYGVKGYTHVPKMLTLLLILTKMKPIFFIHYHNYVCYNSATPYMINQRGHLINKKTLGQGEMGKIWSINPLLAITHKTEFFPTIISSTAITNHAFSRIKDYVNSLIERDMAYYCR